MVGSDRVNEGSGSRWKAVGMRQVALPCFGRKYRCADSSSKTIIALNKPHTVICHFFRNSSDVWGDSLILTLIQHLFYIERKIQVAVSYMNHHVTHPTGPIHVRIEIQRQT